MLISITIRCNAAIQAAYKEHNTIIIPDDEDEEERCAEKHNVKQRENPNKKKSK